MADKFIEVPANLDDPLILKRFLTELVDKLNGNALISYPILYPAGYAGYVSYDYASTVGQYTNTILEASARANKISGEAKKYITDGLSTQVLSNSEDLAAIATQFGTFYDQATAAAWYGLTVKTGELISGFTVSGVDNDTTTPGTAGSVFAISADTFTVGRAIEDISDPTELAYVNTHNLPYGTMYDTVSGTIIPAFMVEWTGTEYDIFFNGKTEFSNYLVPGTTTINGGYISTGSITTSQLAVGAGIVNGYIQSSDFSTIGGAGFRLKSNAAGTSADPTIYGAYIRGGYIKGTTIDGATLIGEVLNINNLKVANATYPLNTTNFVAYQNFTNSGTSGYFYSASYGSGFISNRIITDIKNITISAFTEGGYYDNTPTSITISRSIDGNAFSIIKTLSTSVSYAPIAVTFIDNPIFSNSVRYSASINSNGGSSSWSIISYNIN